MMGHVPELQMADQYFMSSNNEALEQEVFELDLTRDKEKRSE
jgi:hypothetical protein